MSLLTKKARIVTAREYDNASTQINVPDDIAAQIAQIGRELIPDEHLAGDGRVEVIHITVKYGVQPDENLLRKAMAGFKSFPVELGKTTVFPEASGEGTPVVIEVHGHGFEELHKAVAAAMGILPDEFPYTPHITVAYVTQVEAQHYAGRDEFAGIEFVANAVTLSMFDDDNQVDVPLKTAASPAQVTPEIPQVRPQVRPQVPQQQQEPEEDEEVQRDEPATPEQKQQPQRQPKTPKQPKPKPYKAPKPPAQNKNFKTWFGKSQVRDENGKPMVVYHGTTHDFQVFDPSKGNVEAYYGRALYFTSDQEDVGSNYATETGPDITSRIERRYEQLQNEIYDLQGEELEEVLGEKVDENEDIDALLKEKAKKDIAGQSKGLSMPVYLSIQNPVYVQKKGGTYFNIEFNEETGDESGNGVDLWNAMQLVSGNFEDSDWQTVWEGISGDMEFTAWDFEQQVRNTGGFTDPNSGDQASGEFISQVYQELGFDGVVLDAYGSTFFGPGSGGTMNMEYGTKHYIIWDPTKVKSAIGNVGKFDPKNPSITASLPFKFYPVTDEWIAKAKEFLIEKWAQRHTELQREGVPTDLKGACKFASIFAQKVFGGQIKGNPEHQVVKTPHRIIDLTDEFDPNTFSHDKEWFGNPEHEESMQSCMPRVQQWYDEFRQKYPPESVTASVIAADWDDEEFNDEEQAWDQFTTLQPGTTLYHGTSNEWEEGSELNFPAWFSTNKNVADWFAHRNDEGTPMIRMYRVSSPIKLVELGDKSDMQQFFEMYGIEDYGIETISEGTINAGFEGWYIPDNYRPGDDIMLGDGSKLEYMETHPASKKANRFISGIDPRIAAGATGVGDLGLAKRVMHELMPILGVQLPEPELKIVNQPRAGWLGRDTWRVGYERGHGNWTWGDNTTIDLQRSILNDENTLRRIIAHELCHHAVALTTSTEKIKEEKARGTGEWGYKNFVRWMQGSGHGTEWKQWASKYNAKYGADFVTEKSDESYNVEELELRPYHILLKRDYDGKLAYESSSRISPKMKRQLDRMAQDKEGTEYRLTQTNDRAFFEGYLIGSFYWGHPKDAELQKRLEELWAKAQKVLPSGAAKEQDEILAKMKQYDWLNRGKKSAVKSYYHVSSVFNRPSIEKQGLLPQTKEYQHVPRPAGVYVFSKYEDAVNWAYDYWHEFVAGTDEIDIWEVKIDSKNLKPDTHGQVKGGFYSTEAVPPQNLKLMDTLSEDGGLGKEAAAPQLEDLEQAYEDQRSTSLPQIDKLEHGVTKDYDRVRWVYQQFYDNQIRSMSWKDFQKKFPWAQNSPLFTQVRQNRPQITLEDLDRWMEEYNTKAKEYQNYELEHDTYRDKDTSFRDVEQLVLRVNQSASAAEIIGEDEMLRGFLEQVQMGSQRSGHPVSKNTVGWLRVDFINDQWLLIDEVQSDLINAVDLAKRFIAEPSLASLMQGYKSETVKQKIQEMGATEAMFQNSKREFARRGYTPEKLEEMKQSLAGLFKDWAEYGIASIIEIARRHGIKNIAIHTGGTIAQRDPDVEADKVGMYYDQIAKAFGFKKQQLDIGELKGEFWTRTASAKVAGKRNEAVTSMTVGTDSPEFPSPVLIRWEQGMRWREVLKVVKSIVGEVAGHRVPWREIHIWASLWADQQTQNDGWVEERAKGTRVMYDILHNGSFVSVGKATTAPLGEEVIEASHKETPLSDTMFNEPEYGTETNAYANMPEKVKGDEELPALETLAPQMFEKESGEAGPTPEGIEYRIDVLDSRRGELFCRAEAWLDGERVGYVDFNELEMDVELSDTNYYQEKLDEYGAKEWERTRELPREIFIKYVHVDEPLRRMGIATGMYEKIKQEFPGEKIISSGTTEEGGKMRRKMVERGVLAGTKEQDEEAERLYNESIANEGKGPENRGLYEGKRFWSGIADVADGWIIEVHSYEEAERADFHHSFYISHSSQQMMREGDYAFFWVDRNGRVNTEHTNKFDAPEGLEEKIRSHIDVPRTASLLWRKAQYGEQQNQVQHTDHTAIGLTKTLKSNPFHDELQILNDSLGKDQPVPNPALDSGRVEGQPTAKGEDKVTQTRTGAKKALLLTNINRFTDDKGFATSATVEAGLSHPDYNSNDQVKEGGLHFYAAGPVVIDWKKNMYGKFKLTVEHSWHEYGDPIDTDEDVNESNWNLLVVNAFDTTKKQVGQPGKWVGSAEFVLRHGDLESCNTEVSEEYRRQGIATAMYQFAEGFTGHGTSPHNEQSPAGRSLWQQKNRPFGKGAAETDEDFGMMGKVGPFYRIDTMRYDDVAAFHGKRFADKVRNGQKVTVYRAGKPGETLKPGTFLSANKNMALSYQHEGTESFGGPELYRYEVDPKDLLHVENFEASELVWKPRTKTSAEIAEQVSQVPKQPWEMKRDEYAPRPKIVKDEKGQDIYEEETDEQARERYRKSREWEQDSLGAMSLGKMTPEQAKERGYWTDVDKPSAFKPLPAKLYHVTTNASAVYSQGLKTRHELAMDQGGTGLGGGTDKAISFTTDLSTASGIYRAIIEGIRVLNGKISVQRLIDEATKGVGADRPWINELINWGGAHFVSYSENDPNRWTPGKPYPPHTQAFFEGKKIVSPPNMGTPDDEMGDAEPIGYGWTGGDGKQRHTQYKVKLTPEEQRETTFDFFKTWLTARENAGGHLNPLFFSSNVNALAATPEDEVAILEFKPVPGALGTQESALGEWRVYTGRAVQLVGMVPPNVKVAKRASNIVSGEDVVSYVQKLNKWDRQTAYQVVGLDAGGDYILTPEYDLDKLEAGDDYDPSAAERYAKMKTPFPPIVLDMDGKIRDGNHRVAAGKIRGDKSIAAYEPLDTYEP